MPKVDKKDIAKLKHPNSRKTIALAKQMKRAAHRQKKKTESMMKLNIVGEKILWFKERLIPDIKVYSPEQVQELLELYLNRFDEELEQIQLKHSIGNRKNRQYASREDVILMNKKHDLEEYKTCGIEMPDLLNEKQLKMLRNWNGELRYIQNFKLRRIGKKHLENLQSHNTETSNTLESDVSKDNENVDKILDTESKLKSDVENLEMVVDE